ncbi:hypothetical protein GCM10017688_07300 [Streptomyces ramulosus]
MDPQVRTAHAPAPAPAHAPAASRLRTGRVNIFAMHGGTADPASWLRARYALGLSPTSSVKRELNDPSDVHPTAKQTSVTDMSPRRSNAFARSIRRVMTYAYGVSPKAARKLREKCPADLNALRASAGTSSGSAYSRSTRSRTRRSRTSSSNVMHPE